MAPTIKEVENSEPPPSARSFPTAIAARWRTREFSTCRVVVTGEEALQIRERDYRLTD